MCLACALTTTAQQFNALTRAVRIAVPQTGFYELSDSLLLAAGFSDPQRVKVYGYGGALQPEKLTRQYLDATDPLPQVPTAVIGGQRLMYAVGPVNWADATALGRQRNVYSDVGCYFLTDEGYEQPAVLDSADFVGTYYPQPADYHALYEVDDYAWYHGGRNLYDRRLFGSGVGRTYTLPTHGNRQARMSIYLSYAGYCDAQVTMGDSLVGRLLVDETTTKGRNRKQYLDSYSASAADVWTFDLQGLPADSVSISISQTSGADMRLDRIELCFPQPQPLLSALPPVLPQPQLLETVSLGSRHADGPADMVIIVPASGRFMQQAQRLAQLHTDYDQLRVRIVRADELYNEFSSGTPDANAYRRYLKMLYDRAATAADRPRFLLLFGDAVFDNRMRTSNFSLFRPEDFLLCYESENSMSETACYVTDDYFTMLDDDEGGDLIKYDKSDVAVGRFPCRTDEEAATLVDKACTYRMNPVPGAWQNTICMMGDDGNANMHMVDADTVANIVARSWPAYQLKKIYWDAYQRVETATGYAYPDVTSLIRQQMNDGALLMNYSGHGAAISFSHEKVVLLNDFKQPTSQRLPLWFTASCDIAPFDGYQENIGEQAVLNAQGGAIAFVGTTRTVYAIHNRALNKAFTRHLFTLGDDGQPVAIGEALRLAKNEQVQGASTQQQAGINRNHYVLLGDPALRLPLPTLRVVVDSINGQSVADGTMQQMLAGSIATVAGHIEGADDFSGQLTLTLRDVEENITCRKNPQAKDEEPKMPLVYRDRPSTLFIGTDSVRQGHFALTLVVPKDISYADAPGQMLLYAVDDSHTRIAHGLNEQFVMVSADDYDPVGEGPAVTAWLDSPAFTDGDRVSPAPLFHAELTDADGINAAEAGIGHALELVVDGMTRYTYSLANYFHYDFGDYSRGTVEFRLPALSEGEHSLRFRAWDVLNHSTLLTMHFRVGPDNTPSSILLPPSTLHPSSSTLHPSPSTLYDLQGRQLSTAGRQGIVLVRQPGGGVKKMLMKGNK